MSLKLPPEIESATIREEDRVRIVTVDRLDVGRLVALPTRERSQAFAAGNWVIKTPARIPARDEYRRNAAALKRKAPVADPMAVIEEHASGHEWIAEAKIEGDTLARQFASAMEKGDAKGFQKLYKRFRSKFDDLATLFFVKLGLIADLRLSNVFDAKGGLRVTDAWLEDCADRQFKHFSDYHPERTFNHLLLSLTEAEPAATYADKQEWLMGQLGNVDPESKEQAERYCRKLRALRATYGMI